jgi:hypothetical protein
MAVTEDVDLFPIMLELVGCLEEEFVAAELPKHCRINVKPGAVATLDFGPGQLAQGNGQAWVRLVGAGPTWPGATDGLPIITDTRCGGIVAYELEVGSSRCEDQGTTSNNRFTPPSAQAELDAVRLYAADRQAMKRAITCCLREKLGDDDLEIGLGLYQPLPSDGGVGGGTWQVFIRRS